MVIHDKARVGISIDEGAEMAGCSPALLYTLVRRGALPGARRAGRRVILHRETFETWLRTGRGDEVGIPGVE